MRALSLLVVFCASLALCACGDDDYNQDLGQHGADQAVAVDAAAD